MALKMMVQTVPEVQPHMVPVEHTMSPIEALTHEYLSLHKKATQYGIKDIVKRMEEIRKTLMETANTQGDDKKAFVFSCDEGDIEFSERAKNTDIVNPSKLIQDLTEKFDANVAWSVVNIALTPLRQILSENELKKYTKETAGSRTVRLVKVT